MVVVSPWFEFKIRHKKHELIRNDDLIYYPDKRRNLQLCGLKNIFKFVS